MIDWPERILLYSHVICTLPIGIHATVSTYGAYCSMGIYTLVLLRMGPHKPISTKKIHTLRGCGFLYALV